MSGITSIDAERTLIAAVIDYAGQGNAAPDVIAKVGGASLGESFFDHTLRALWNLMCARHMEGQPNDAVSIGDAIRRGGLSIPGATGIPITVSEMSGWLEAWANLRDQSPNTSAYLWCATQIRDAAVRRAKLVEAGALIERLNNDREPVANWWRSSMDALSEINAAAQATDPTPVAAVREVMEHIERLAEHGQRVSIFGLPTGLHTLDEFLGGLEPGRLITVGARPGMGKSALAFQVAMHAAMQRQASLVVSLEMSRVQVTRRLLSILTGVETTRMRRGAISSHTYADIVPWAQRLSELHIRIEDRMRRWEDIEALCWQAVAQGTKLIVIDYAQLLRVKAPNAAAGWEKLAIITGNAKQMALRLNVPVLLLAQLNRESKKANTRPSLINLGGGDSLGRDSDVVMFIHRDDPEGGPVAAQAEIIVDKNRDGPTGIVTLKWIPQTTHFEDFRPEFEDDRRCGDD